MFIEALAEVTDLMRLAITSWRVGVQPRPPAHRTELAWSLCT